MKKLIKRTSLVFALIFIFTLLSAGAGYETAVSAGNKVSVLIRFSETPGESEKALVRAFGGDIDFTYSIVPGMAAQIPETSISGLLRNPRILSIEPNIEVQAVGTYDAEYADTWGVDRIGADDVLYSGNTGDGVKVAVLDTGINYNHPDLVHAYAGGYDFANKDSDPYDDNGHGTHVAGTIAAGANGFGVIGVAPDVELYALKVLKADGRGDFGMVIAALDWCVLNGIQVTNSSLGSSVDPGSLTEEAFIKANNAGIINISSAGNEGNPPGRGDNVGYPAAYPSVVAVAATDSNDNRAKFSSTGPAVEIAAPGVDIYSTYKETYAWGDGTSMASPHVAGVAALMIKAGITNPDDIRAAMIATAEDLGDPGWDTKYGHGLINAAAAVGGTTPVNQAPVVDITSPADGSTFYSGATVTFTGTADDEEGNLSSSIAWVSSIDGPLGTGASVSYALSDGVHTITAKATDSGNLTGSDSITVTVEVPGPEDSIGVSQINYEPSGGRNSTAHLSITATVMSGTNYIDGAEVTIEVATPSGVRTFTGTSSGGVAVFKITNAPGGYYTSQVISVVASGYTWDGLTPYNEYNLIK